MVTLPAVLTVLALSARAEPFLDGLAAFQAKKYPQAAALFQAAADDGNDYAQAYLAHMYFTGKSEGLEPDAAKAADLFKKAAKAGNPAGEWGLGLIADDESSPLSFSEAAKHYRRAAAQGFAAAQVNLGVTLVNPIDVSNDGKTREAIQLFRQVIDAGAGFPSWLAMQDMGWCSSTNANNHCLPMNAAETLRWHRKAALASKNAAWLRQIDQQEADKVQWAGGSLVKAIVWAEEGDDGLDEVMAWLRRDAEAGRASAQYLVGAAGEEGFNGPKKAADALKWYKKAAAQGYEPAQRRLEVLSPSGKKESAPIAAAAPPSYSSDVDKPPFKLPERPDAFAFIVGIEKYKNVPAARFAERDAAAFRAHSLALGVPERNVIFLEGENATRPKMQAYLDEWLPKNVKADSTLFVYYSGHGAPDAETRQGYLLPWDAEPQFLQSTAYALKDFYAALNRLKAKRVIVALDSCFSGAGGRSVMAPGLRPLVTKIDPTQESGRLVVFAAASGEQVSGSLDDQGHGVFTYYFLKGLAAGAKDSGELTTRALYSYLKPRVEDASARQNRTQNPQLAGSGDEVLLRVK